MDFFTGFEALWEGHMQRQKFVILLMKFGLYEPLTDLQDIC